MTRGFSAVGSLCATAGAQPAASAAINAAVTAPAVVSMRFFIVVASLVVRFQLAASTAAARALPLQRPGLPASGCRPPGR